jgi:hypothetical protein
MISKYVRVLGKLQERYLKEVCFEDWWHGQYELELFGRAYHSNEHS